MPKRTILLMIKMLEFLQKQNILKLKEGARRHRQFA